MSTTTADTTIATLRAAAYARAEQTGHPLPAGRLDRYTIARCSRMVFVSDGQTVAARAGTEVLAYFPPDDPPAVFSPLLGRVIVAPYGVLVPARTTQLETE